MKYNCDLLTSFHIHFCSFFFFCGGIGEEDSYFCQHHVELLILVGYCRKMRKNPPDFSHLDFGKLISDL